MEDLNKFNEIQQYLAFSVSSIFKTNGFTSLEYSSIEILIDIFDKYVESICQLLYKFYNTASRNKADWRDIFLVLEELEIDVNSVIIFAKQSPKIKITPFISSSVDENNKIENYGHKIVSQDINVANKTQTKITKPIHHYAHHPVVPKVHTYSNSQTYRVVSNDVVFLKGRIHSAQKKLWTNYIINFFEKNNEKFNILPLNNDKKILIPKIHFNKDIEDI